MKASDIEAISARVLDKKSIQPTPVTEQAGSPQPILEKKTAKKESSVEPSSAAPVFGVDDPNGHVIKRIRHSKPHLWHKIQNWD